MESYGTLLRQARESKAVDIETASRETSIAPQYIKGLEEEDTAAFPGEPYLIGFLKNYSDYLGVDSVALTALYRSKQIQESPVPEGLLEKQRPAFLIPVIIVSCVVVAAMAVGSVLVCVNKTNTHKDDNVVVSEHMQPRKYELTGAPFSGRLYQGDQIIVPSKSTSVVLTVKDTLSSLGIDTPAGVLYTDLSEESEKDIDGDGISDLIVYVSDVSSTDSSRGAEVRLLVKHDIGSATIAPAESQIETETVLQSVRKPQVILEDTRAYPFTINASFRGPCVFRYRIDRKTSEENYFTNGDLVTMTANNGVRLWMSNCNAVKYTIIADTRSYDLDIGRAGQVLAEDVKWIKSAEGKYQLVVVELD